MFCSATIQANIDHKLICYGKKISSSEVILVIRPYPNLSTPITPGEIV